MARATTPPEGNGVLPLPGGAIYVKLVLTALFWGGTFIAGRVIAPEIAPAAAAFLRFAVAGVFLLAFTGRQCAANLPRLELRDVCLVVLLGLTGVFAYNVLFFAGLKHVPASRAALIVSSNPAFITLGAAFFFRERLRLLNLIGVGCSMLGAVTVISRGNPFAMLQSGVAAADLYILGCVASWVCYSLAGKVAMERLPPLVTVTYACISGALLLLVPALAEGMPAALPHYPLRVWGGVLYLGLFGSALGFSWFYEGIHKIGPSRAGVFINFVPISSIALAAVLLDEALDRSLALGAILVLTGAYLAQRTR
jgi:drug/metabolite transporter (DMT)-like permease